MLFFSWGREDRGHASEKLTCLLCRQVGDSAAWITEALKRSVSRVGPLKLRKPEPLSEPPAESLLSEA